MRHNKVIQQKKNHVALTRRWCYGVHPRLSCPLVQRRNFIKHMDSEDNWTTYVQVRAAFPVMSNHRNSKRHHGLLLCWKLNFITLLSSSTLLAWIRACLTSLWPLCQEIHIKTWIKSLPVVTRGCYEYDWIWVSMVTCQNSPPRHAWVLKGFAI